MAAALPPRRNSCVRWHRGWSSFRSATATASGIRTRPWCAVTANRVVTWLAPIWPGRFWSKWAVRGSRRRAGGSSNGVTGKGVDFAYRYMVKVREITSDTASAEWLEVVTVRLSQAERELVTRADLWAQEYYADSLHPAGMRWIEHVRDPAHTRRMQAVGVVFLRPEVGTRYQFAL